jgi:hypothetical protein
MVGGVVMENNTAKTNACEAVGSMIMSADRCTKAFLRDVRAYVESPCFLCLGFLESDDVGYGGLVSRIVNMTNCFGSIGCYGICRN